MITYCIDRRCTVDVNATSRGYTFEYGGKKHRSRTEEGVHQFFLKEYRSEKLDTVKLRLSDEKYYLHFTLDESEKFTSKRALRSVLAQENEGAWIEEKNGKQRYFMEKGWLFSRAKEVSEEEFTAHQPSRLMNTISKLALGVLSFAPSAASVLSRHSLGAGLVGFSLLHASPVLAQMPAFGEFRINTNTTKFVSSTFSTGGNSRSVPKLTGLSGGGFVAAWMSYDQDGSGEGIYGQIYNAAGFPVGSEFRINTNTTSDQEFPTLAGLTDGGFVAAWMGDQTGDYDIYGQRYNASGAAVGSEFPINTVTTSDQRYPTLAGLTDGGFVAAWMGYQTGNYHIYGQRYDAAGLPVASEFLINTVTTNDQENPTLAGLIDGGFVAAWDDGQTGAPDIYGQRYNASGTPVVSEFLINIVTTGTQTNPTLAGLTNGGFVVAWRDNQLAGTEIYGQRYDAAGFPVGSEFRINTVTTYPHDKPTLAGLTDGGFVAAWESLQTGNWDSYGQRYDALGAAVGSEFRFNTVTTSAQRHPTLAGLTDGGFVAAWYSLQTGYSDIYGQRYDANGVPVQPLPAPSSSALLSSSSIQAPIPAPSSSASLSSSSIQAPLPVPSPLAGTSAAGTPTPSLSSAAPVGSSSVQAPLPVPSPFPSPLAGSPTPSLSSAAPVGSSSVQAPLPVPPPFPSPLAGSPTPSLSSAAPVSNPLLPAPAPFPSPLASSPTMSSPTPVGNSVAQTVPQSTHLPTPGTAASAGVFRPLIVLRV